jgi:peptidoglycan-associated lipoprotein
MRDRKSAVLVAGVMLASTLVLGGCATKKFVRNTVAPVASRVDNHDGRITSVDSAAQDALARAEAAGKLAEGKFLYSMVLSDDGVKFPFDKSELGSEAEAKLAELAQKLKAENKNVYIEVQGHTDATGPTGYNEKLGEWRADAVRRYLNSQGVALNRIGVISYGEASPVAPNESRQGRAQNRRVVIIVLA